MSNDYVTITCTCGCVRRFSTSSLMRDQHYRCSRCGTDVHVDTSQFRRGMQEVERELKKFERDIKRMFR